MSKDSYQLLHPHNDVDGSDGAAGAAVVPLSSPSHSSASPRSPSASVSRERGPSHSHRTPLLSADSGASPSDSPASSTGFVSIAAPAPVFNVNDSNRSNYSSVAATHSPKPQARRIMRNANNKEDSPTAPSRFNVQTGAEEAAGQSTTADEAHRMSNGSSARPSPSSSVNAPPSDSAFDSDKDAQADDTVLAVKRAPGEHPDGDAPVYTHLGHQFLPGPPCVRNILGNELCERFSWYGLRAILVLYFHERLGWSKPSAISMFSYSSALAYFMPLLGGYLSDSRLGKYKTILSFSLIYVCGCAVLAGSAVHGTVWLSIVGLVLIGTGTGGIKPCVSSFGADQFTRRQVTNASELAQREKDISSFFACFYFTINMGSVCSFIITPILRQKFGYSVAFAVPAVLLTLATIIFYSARNQYYRSKPAGSVLSQLGHTFSAAWKRRGAHLSAEEIAAADAGVASAGTPHNWLDNALGADDVTPVMVENAKSLWRVLPIFAVLPVFWMLFNQQSSSWTLQADDMKLHGLQPEQVGVVNPVLIMILLPLFDRVIYPTVRRCGVNFTPLRRMGVGMLICIVAFLMSAGVQHKISSEPKKSVTVFLQLPQICLISIAEILISVTGLEFAYTQAAPQLKSCITAVFLITSAVGDLLTGVLFDALSPVLSATMMLVLFAGLMVLNLCAFVYVARQFKPVIVVDDKIRGADEDQTETEEEKIAKAKLQADYNNTTPAAAADEQAANKLELVGRSDSM